MAKILFIGTAEFGIPALEKLIKEHEIVGVVTQPDKPAGRNQELTASPIKQWLLQNTSDVQIFQPLKLKQEAESIMEQTQPELVVVVAYGQILPEIMVNQPKFGAVNIHGSLLPKYRGAIPIEKALLNGDSTVGVSILQMTPALDDGPVWLEAAFEVNPNDDAVSLRKSLSLRGAELLLESIKLIMSGEVEATPQDELAEKYGREVSYCYAPELARENAEIKPNESLKSAWNKVRAFANASGAWLNITSSDSKPRELKIWRALPVEGELNDQDHQSVELAAKPWGTIKREGKRLIINLGGGKLELLELQLAGKKRDSASNYFFLANY